MLFVFCQSLFCILLSYFVAYFSVCFLSFECICQPFKNIVFSNFYAAKLSAMFYLWFSVTTCYSNDIHLVIAVTNLRHSLYFNTSSFKYITNNKHVRVTIFTGTSLHECWTGTYNCGTPILCKYAGYTVGARTSTFITLHVGLM